MKNIETLATYLAKISKEICQMNECTEEKHKCESYAYINQDMQLLDVCASDYFQGSSNPCAAISLPWVGSDAELVDEVLDQCQDFAE